VRVLAHGGRVPTKERESLVDTGDVLNRSCCESVHGPGGGRSAYEDAGPNDAPNTPGARPALITPAGNGSARVEYTRARSDR
jgi:hypothetical protein